MWHALFEHFIPTWESMNLSRSRWALSERIERELSRYYLESIEGSARGGLAGSMHCAALLGFVAISNDATGGHACLRNSLLTVDAPAGGAEVDFELADAAFGFFDA